MAWKFNAFTNTLDYYEPSGSGGGSVSIQHVSVFSALPNPTTVTVDEIFVVDGIEDEYPAGAYYSNGTTWIYPNVPIPSTQVEVDAGTNTTTFITPDTLANADQWNTKFDEPAGTISQYIRGDGSLETFPDILIKSTYDTDDDGVVDASEREQIQVINKTGATLTKGTIVYIKSTSSSTNYPEVLKANANSEITSSKTIGAIYEDILDSAVGYIITSGQVHNLNTAAYVVGDKLWLSTTDGLVSTSIPAEPNHTVFIGYVTRSQAVNGRVLYAIQNGYELDELHGVLVPSPATNDFLYFAADGLWKNKAIAGADITQSSSYRFVSDSEKSTWNAKENAIAAGTTGQYWRGDKSWQTLDKSAVGLSNVENTADLDKVVSTATTTAINTATSNTSILSKILTGLNITGGAITSTNTILEAFGQVQNQINTLFGQDIVTVANYSALPAASTVSGKFYWCQASQGTSWLPGTLGGTYYNAGLYHSNGTTWEWQQYAYQATQAEVNAGIVTDKFVTPATLTSSTQITSKADIASPTFTGVPAGPTAAPGTNTTQLATTAFVLANAGGGGPASYIAGIASIDFGNEQDSVVVTIADTVITSTTVLSAVFLPQETTETSLDDFNLNGVTFNLENIVNNTSFDIRGTASNDASGNYTIKYIIQLL